MNFRLDSSSVRVRVSKVEAEELLKERVLRQTMKLPGGGIDVAIYCESSLTFNLIRKGLNSLEVHVPRHSLEELCNASAAAKLSIDSKSSDGDFKFEIDLFKNRTHGETQK